MFTALYTAKSGMTVQQTNIDLHSHNLSNVSTTGFKRNFANVEDLAYQNYRQVGAAATEQNQLPTGLHMGLGARTVSIGRNFEQGSLQESKNSLDVAINGNGFFEVTMPDGTIGYTRDGSFKVDAQGRLVTSGGLPVANGITIPPNATNISISNDGAVSATVPGNTQPQPLGNLAMSGFVNAGGLEPIGQNLFKESAASGQPQQGTPGTTAVSIGADGAVSALLPGNPAPQPMGQLAMSSFINPAGLEPIGQNLFKESAASGQPQEGTPGTNGLGVIKQGYLETSNVNVVQELVTMIQTQRAYEMNSKAISTSDQMLAKLSQL